MRLFLLPLSLVLACGCVAAPASATAPPARTSIVGGGPAAPGQLPSIVAIAYKGAKEAFCGGTLVAPTKVLTAAHCFEDGTRASEVDIISGTLRLSRGGVRTGVARVVMHPGYNRATHYDAAMLTLRDPLALPPAPLAGPGSEPLTAPGAPLRIGGWGTQKEGEDSSLSDVLKTALTAVKARRRCTSQFGADYQDSIEICAGNAAGPPDTCQGDSGGPLLAPTTPLPTLVGVVSYGNGCAGRGLPGVYTRVSAIRGFIAREAGIVLDAATDLTPPPAPRPRGGVRTSVGRITCGVVICTITVRLTGKNATRANRIVVRARRASNRHGVRPADRAGTARKVRGGIWRARVNLPFGDVTFFAQPYDEDGARLGRGVKQELTVFLD